MSTPPRPRAALLILLGASCLLLSALFVHLGSEVGQHETRSFDQAIRQWMLGRQSPAGLAIFGIITRLGEQPALAAAAVIVMWRLVQRGAGVRSLLCGLPFFCPLVVRQLKGWYLVMRPPTDLFASTDPTSFPSAHTSDCTAVALVLGYVLARDGDAPRIGLAIATGLPLLVGVSRLYLDRHWGSDVTGGWIFGAAFASAVCVVYELVHMRSARMARIVLGSGGPHASNPHSGEPNRDSSTDARDSLAASRGANSSRGVDR